VRKLAWTGPFRNAVRAGFDCSRGMEHTVQVLAEHCVLKQSSDIVARASCSYLPSQQTGNSSTSSRLLQQRLLQHTVMHTTAASVGQQGTHTGVHTHAQTHSHARIQTHSRAHTHTLTRMRMCSHIQTQACVRMHTGAHKHRGTHAHTLKRTHAYARTRCARDGLRQFSSVASDAPTLVINIVYL